MSEVEGYPIGTFCWNDLATTDPEAAQAFYTDLLGWAYNAAPMGEDGYYYMAQRDGKDVGAIFGQPDEQREAGVPPHWRCYISVDSADEATEKAKGLGAEIIAGPFDVPEAGRMTTMKDPSGAMVNLWEGKGHYGARLIGEPGAFCWNELYTHDVQAATDFYCGLLGWTAQVQDMEGVSYTMFMNGEWQAAGMMKIDEGWGPVPPHWTVYFAVSDCDKAVETVQSNGGEVRVGPQDIPGIGRFSLVADPQGAGLGVIHLTNPS